MKTFIAMSVGLVLFATATDAQAPAPSSSERQAQAPSEVRPSGDQQQRLAPGMADFTDSVLFGDVWRRPELSQRDRSLVVISVLIATDKPAQLKGHLGRALTNGVTPAEASGVLTHLAFYAGWPSAVSALDVFEQVYKARNIDLAVLRTPLPRLPAMASDSDRARSLSAELGTVAPKFTQLTNESVFNGLWRRSDLSVRDRSLVTLAALAAMGEADQLDQYLKLGVESGLTQTQIAEAMTHLAFYAGWPKATKALSAVKHFADQGGFTKAERGGAASSSNFVGSVAVGPSTRGTDGSRIRWSSVTFQSGARTNWHRHPQGQLLIVTADFGWTQIAGQAVRTIGRGDVIWTPPNAKHWHGATRSGPVTHVAVSEDNESRAVEWLEPVTEEQFHGPVQGTRR